jgi:adenylate kinase family enzyme
MENQRLYLTAALNYRLPLNEIVARLSGRRTRQGCKAVCHATERPPRVAGICDRCGGKLFQREDDRPESVQVRLEAYEKSAADRVLPAARPSCDDRGARGLAEAEFRTRTRVTHRILRS